MTWSFVGSVSTVNVNGAASASLSLPAGVQGGDLIVAAWCFYNTTVTIPAFATAKNSPGSQGAKDAFWCGTRVAAGTAGSATSDTTFTCTFGANTWGESVVLVLRSTAGVGTISSAEYNSSAGYVTACPDAVLTPGSGTDAVIWGYAGQNSSVGGTATSFSGTGPSGLSNFIQQGFASNGGGIGMGWGAGKTSPGGATANQAIDPTDFAIDVAEAVAAVPPQAAVSARVPPGRQSPMAWQSIARYPAPVLPQAGTTLATSASAKALQRAAADKVTYLFDGSLLATWWTGSAGQVAQIINPLTSPVVNNLITTVEDGTSLWVDNSSGISSDIWVASSGDDAASSGIASITVRHGVYNGSTFTWDTATSVPGPVSPNTESCTITWNGTYLIVLWWDGISGTDRICISYTNVKAGTSGWVSGGTFSESGTWSTICQVNVRHSVKLGATVVTYGGNSQMHYAVLKDSAASPAVANWGGRVVFDQYTDNYISFGGPQLIIDEVSGAIHCVRATPNSGGPTWTGVAYWLGTYSATGSGSVSWAARVIADSASSATGPADIAVAVDINGKVYVIWTTDTSNDTMKYATLVSPYTSAVAGGIIYTPGGNTRWPHVPAISASQSGLSASLPVLYMDISGSPYPVRLDTSVQLALPSVTYGVSGIADADTMDANGAVIAALVISGSALPASQASGVISANALMTGSSASASAANGTVNYSYGISASSVTASTSNGTLGSAGAVTGTASGTVSASGAVIATLVINGSAPASSWAVGNLIPPSTSIYPVGSFACIAVTGASSLNMTTAGQGDLIVFGSKVSFSSLGIVSIAGTGTAGWTKVAGPYTDNNATVRNQEIWIGYVTTPSLATTLNVTWNGTNNAATDLYCQQFSTGYTWSVYSRDGTQWAGQNNAASTTHNFTNLTAAYPGELWIGTVRVPGGGNYTTPNANCYIIKDCNNNPFMYGLDSPSGSLTRWLTDTVSVVSYAVGVLVRYINNWEVDGSSSTGSGANGNVFLYELLTGSSQSASTANGAVVQKLVTSGFALTASAGNGAVTLSMAIAGSAPSVSVANGTLSASGALIGSAQAVSAANGVLGLITTISGVSAIASLANGNLGSTPVTGSAPAVSSGSGAVVSLMAVAGSSVTVSQASGMTGAVGVISGLAGNISQANGAVGQTIIISGASATASLATGALSAAGVLAGSSASQASASGAIILIGMLAGQSVTSSTANGTFGIISPLTGNSSTQSQASGVVTIQVGAVTYQVSGNSVATPLANGALTLTGALNGSSATQSTASGSLAALAALAGSSATVSVAPGTVTLTGVLSGSSSAISAASGSLSALAALAGSGQAQSMAAGTVTLLMTAAGMSATVSQASGNLGGQAPMYGSSVTGSVASGAVILLGVLSGSSVAVSVASGSFGVLGVLAGSSATLSAATGAVAMRMSVAGMSATVSLATGTLAGQAPMSGSAVGVSVATGTLARQIIVSGSSAAISGASGAIFTVAVLAGTSAAASLATGALSLVIPALPLAGVSVTASFASGAVTLLGVLSGASATVSLATGTIAAAGVLGGVSVTVSRASGTVTLAMALAGSSNTFSRTTGSVVEIGYIAGISITISVADGWVQPPFIPGLLPPHIDCIVTVEQITGVRMTIEHITALIVTDKTSGTVGTKG